jgi:septum site-determining protein MinD
MTRYIGVVSGKGGVGKTTVVTNLSTALATKFQKQTTVVDCNVTASHLSMHFGAYFSPVTLNNVLKNEATIEQAIFKHASGVKVIPASMNLTDLIGVDISILREKIQNLFINEDFVILDTAPGFGKEAISATKACKEVLIVTTPDIPSITDVIRGKAVLEELGIEPLGLIVNKVTGGKFELTNKEMMQLTGLTILAKIPYEKKILESLAAKTPLVFYDDKSRASTEFFKLASTLTGEFYEPPQIGFSFFEKLSKIFEKLS